MSILTMSEQKSTKAHQVEMENSSLKEQVVRLNKELINYQSNAGIKPSFSDSSDSQTNRIQVPELISDCEAIAPLLTAYDHRIEELTNYIEKQGSVLDILTQRSNDLLVENENLRKRLVQGLPDKKADRHEVITTQELSTKQLLSDKHLLEEQAELLVKELHNANKVIASRDDNISSLSEEVKNKLVTIKDLTTKVQKLLKEKGNCEKELISQTKKIAVQNNHIEELQVSVNKLEKEKSHLSSKTESVMMDKHYFEIENETLTTKITQSASFIQELKHQLSTGADEYKKINASYLATKNRLFAANEEIEKIKQSHNELKIQFSLSNTKAKKMEKVHHEISMELKDVELSRDKALATTASLDKEVNRLLLQSKEFVNNSSNGSGQWQNDTCQEIKRRDQLIHTLKKQNNELTIEAENDRRHCNLKQSALDNIDKCIEKERMTTKSTIETLQSQLSSLEAKYQYEHLQKTNLMNENQTLRQEVATLQDGSNAKQSEIHALRLDEKRKAQEHTKVQQRLQKKINELSTTLKLETAKIIEEKEHLEMELDEIKHQKESKFDTIQYKNQQVEKSLEEITKCNKILRDDIQSTVERNEIIQRESEAKQQVKLVEIQASLENQSKKNRELLSNIGAVAEENFNLGVMLTKKDELLYQSEQKLLLAEGKVSSLSKQIHDNLSEQCQKVSQLKALKMELRELKLKTAQI